MDDNKIINFRDKAEHIPDPDAQKPEDWDDEMGKSINTNGHHDKTN